MVKRIDALLINHNYSACMNNRNVIVSDAKGLKREKSVKKRDIISNVQSHNRGEKTPAAAKTDTSVNISKEKDKSPKKEVFVFEDNVDHISPDSFQSLNVKSQDSMKSKSQTLNSFTSIDNNFKNGGFAKTNGSLPTPKGPSLLKEIYAHQNMINNQPISLDSFNEQYQSSKKQPTIANEFNRTSCTCRDGQTSILKDLIRPQPRRRASLGNISVRMKPSPLVGSCRDCNAIDVDEEEIPFRHDLVKITPTRDLPPISQDQIQSGFSRRTPQRRGSLPAQHMYMQSTTEFNQTARPAPPAPAAPIAESKFQFQRSVPQRRGSLPAQQPIVRQQLARQQSCAPTSVLERAHTMGSLNITSFKSKANQKLSSLKETSSLTRASTEPYNPTFMGFNSPPEHFKHHIGISSLSEENYDMLSMVELPEVPGFPNPKESSNMIILEASVNNHKSSGKQPLYVIL